MIIIDYVGSTAATSEPPAPPSGQCVAIGKYCSYAIDIFSLIKCIKIVVFH